MNGAREYAKLFSTGQYGRLYIVSSQHARGLTFHIYVLPENEEAQGNGSSNGPLNENAVEVFGILGGNPGWTEWYGWLYNGPWVEDFQQLVNKRKEEIARNNAIKEAGIKSMLEKEEERKQALLSTYKKKDT